MARKRRFTPPKPDPAYVSWQVGTSHVRWHPLFAPLMSRALVIRTDRGGLCPKDGWIVVTADGQIHCNPTRRAEPTEWTYAIGHGLLHLAFGHVAHGIGKQPHEWTAACCAVVARFLADLRLGEPPLGFGFLAEGLPRSEGALYQHFLERGIPRGASCCVSGGLRCGEDGRDSPLRGSQRATDWEGLFARGLTDAVADVVEVASGRRCDDACPEPMTPARAARS